MFFLLILDFSSISFIFLQLFLKHETNKQTTLFSSFLSRHIFGLSSFFLNKTHSLLKHAIKIHRRKLSRDEARDGGEREREADCAVAGGERAEGGEEGFGAEGGDCLGSGGVGGEGAGGRGDGAQRRERGGEKGGGRGGQRAEAEGMGGAGREAESPVGQQRGA